MSDEHHTCEAVDGPLRAGQVFVISFVCTDGVKTAVDYHGDMPLGKIPDLLADTATDLADALRSHQDAAQRAEDLLAKMAEARETGGDVGAAVREGIGGALGAMAAEAGGSIEWDGDTATIKREGKPLVVIDLSGVESVAEAAHRFADAAEAAAPA